MTYKALSADSRFIKLSEGNAKLVANGDTKFLIFNLPSKITCPYATALCKQFCYAVKAETAYPTCLPSRMRHFEDSKKSDFVERMIYTIEAHLTRKSYQNAKKVVVRIHESGDFYNMPYMGKWYEIAEHFKNNKKVVFMAYTKSVVFIDELAKKGLAKPNNLKIRFSVWDDTEAEQIAIAEKYDLPIYTAVEKFNKSIPSQNRCLCRDCGKCGKCWGNTKKLICEIH